jgi:hypothetical protein
MMNSGMGYDNLNRSFGLLADSTKSVHSQWDKINPALFASGLSI